MNLKIDSKPKTDFVLRPIGEDDVPAITSLYKLCFEDKPTEKFIRWRYLRKRVGTPTILAFKGSTCVASYAVWLTPLTLNEEEVLGAVGIDAMTHPDFRGHGLFVQLANKCYDLISQHGCKVLYGFAGDNSLPVGARRLNWDHLCDIPRWTRPLWILGTSPLSGLVAATSLLWSSTSAKQLRLAAEAPRAEMIAALAERHEETRGICRVKRDREWYAWRYQTESDRNYRWIAAYAGAELRGVGVWRFDPANRRAHLCELIGDPQSISAVLHYVLRAVYRQKARALDFPTNDPALIPLLKSEGFFRRPGPHFVVRSLTGKTLPANIHAAETWRIHGGDLDYF